MKLEVGKVSGHVKQTGVGRTREWVQITKGSTRQSKLGKLRRVRESKGWCGIRPERQDKTGQTLGRSWDKRTERTRAQ